MSMTAFEPAPAGESKGNTARDVFIRAKMRSGEEYLRSLKDGRRVFANGERVKDVTTHPAFREAARSIARLFDIAAAPENRELMTYPSPKTGAPGWRGVRVS